MDEGGAFLGFLFVLAVTLAIGLLIAVPAWQILLGLESFWLTVGLLATTGAVAARIHLPTFFRAGDKRVCLNLCGFFAPIAVIGYVAHHASFPLAATPVPALVMAGVAMAVGYFLASRMAPIGVMIPFWTVHLLGLCVLGLTWLLGMGLRELMWWSFTLQYGTLLVADLARLFKDHHRLASGVSAVSVGGAGSRDVLWTGPVGTVTWAYLLHLIAGWF